jgi:ATP-dependent exoDNAse (exonuclease V) beta subunit
MLNWRRDPERETRLKELERKELLLEQKEQLLERRAMQLKKEHALLDWIESEIALIEADLPSSSTPPLPIDANSSAC